MEGLFHREELETEILSETMETANPRAFSEDEVAEALKRLGRNKAPGGDQLKDQLLRSQLKDPEVVSHTAKALSGWYTAGKVPAYANRATIIPLSKQDTEYPEYGKVRPIAVLPAIFKLYETLILERLKPQVTHKLNACQRGFREGLSIYTNLADLCEFT